jgi:hypothetical protein
MKTHDWKADAQGEGAVGGDEAWVAVEGGKTRNRLDPFLLQIDLSLGGIDRAVSQHECLGCGRSRVASLPRLPPTQQVSIPRSNHPSVCELLPWNPKVRRHYMSPHTLTTFNAARIFTTRFSKINLSIILPYTSSCTWLHEVTETDFWKCF